MYIRNLENRRNIKRVQGSNSGDHLGGAVLMCRLSTMIAVVANISYHVLPRRSALIHSFTPKFSLAKWYRSVKKKAFETVLEHFMYIVGWACQEDPKSTKNSNVNMERDTAIEARIANINQFDDGRYDRYIRNAWNALWEMWSSLAVRFFSLAPNNPMTWPIWQAVQPLKTADIFWPFNSACSKFNKFDYIAGSIKTYLRRSGKYT